jgi:hypothetical protein
MTEQARGDEQQEPFPGQQRDGLGAEPSNRFAQSLGRLLAHRSREGRNGPLQPVAHAPGRGLTGESERGESGSQHQGDGADYSSSDQRRICPPRCGQQHQGKNW